MQGSVLIVEDDRLNRQTLTMWLEDEGWEVEACGNPFSAVEVLQEKEFDVVITDFRMPGMDGLQFLRESKKIAPDTQVILITAYATVESAIAALKEGALDYMTKPFNLEEISARLEKAMTIRSIMMESVRLRRKLATRRGYAGIIGQSAEMRRVFEQIETLADNTFPVLIEGETGTGKELVAEALHEQSSRKDGPLIKLSCFALSRDLLESELFGHVQGAFTGATKSKRGRFEMADGGTLFLDDIEDVPIEYQAKLLRALQEKTIERVGGEKTIKVDVRVVCATKADLRGCVERGEFRQDLMYRVLGAKIDLPPLRERQEDIIPLITHFLQKHGATERSITFSEKAIRLMLRHRWPGNVRELEHVVESALALCHGETVEPHHLSQYLIEDVGNHEDVVSLHLSGRTEVNLNDVLANIEERLLRWALTQTGGHQGEAAELLSIPRTTLRQKMQKLDKKTEESAEITGRN